MSAYLHFGMVSALRIAAEAERFGGPGAEKYLDELLVWREVAWHFCHHRRDIDTVASLPEWAQETLAEHAADERPRELSWDALAHAASVGRYPQNIYAWVLIYVQLQAHEQQPQAVYLPTPISTREHGPCAAMGHNARY